MSVEPNSDLQLEIGYLLLIDVVGYSKLLVNEQVELLQELNQIVRSTPSFRNAEATGKLIRLPTGDGMALIFSAAQKSRRNALWKFTRHRRAIHIFKYEWAFTVGRSTRSPM